MLLLRFRLRLSSLPIATLIRDLDRAEKRAMETGRLA
jgi:hypothetical protein